MGKDAVLAVGATKRGRSLGRVPTRLIHKRGRKGAYLIETMVALVVGAMVAFALLQILTEVLQTTSTGVNRQSSDLMSQTVLDSMKATPSPLAGGTFQLLPYSTTSGQVASSPLHPLPAGLNMGDLNWVNSTNNPNGIWQPYKFPGTISLTVGAGPDATSQTVSTNVSWADSQYMQGKTVLTQTVVHQRGLNFWPSP